MTFDFSEGLATYKICKYQTNSEVTNISLIINLLLASIANFPYMLQPLNLITYQSYKLMDVQASFNCSISCVFWYNTCLKSRFIYCQSNLGINAPSIAEIRAYNRIRSIVKKNETTIKHKRNSAVIVWTFVMCSREKHINQGRTDTIQVRKLEGIG